MTTPVERRLKRHRRVRKNLSGSPDRPRLAVFRSNRHLYAQLIDDSTGRTMASASTVEIAMRGKRLSAGTATELGRLIADRAAEKGVKSVVFDRGGFLFHGRVKALADAARDKGLEF